MSARTFAAVFVSFALVLPLASSASGSKTVSSRSNKTKVKKAKARRSTQKVKTQPHSKDGWTLRARLFKRKAQAAPKEKEERPGPLTMRKAVREQIKSARTKAKAGSMTAAAAALTPLGVLPNETTVITSNGATRSKMTIRERFAIWRAARKLRISSMKKAKQRSKVGDIEGSKDALKALAKLELAGRLGVIGRFNKARAEQRVYENTAKVRAFRASMTKSAKMLRSNSREFRRLAKESYNLARSYAQAGNPAATWETLQMAAEYAVSGGVKFREAKADSMMVAAYTRATTALVLEAQKEHKAGDLEQSAVKLAEAQHITISVPVKTSRQTRRAQRQLTKKLGELLINAQKNTTSPLKNAQEITKARSEAVKKTHQETPRGAPTASKQLIMTGGPR